MTVISDNLIHFLARAEKDNPNKQLKIFKEIIEKGLRTSKMQIKFGDSGSVHNQVICFTDIPLRECNEHTSIYGKFGIGFKKSYIKNAGGNPARYFIDYTPSHTGTESYVESRGALYFNLCGLIDIFNTLHEYLENKPGLTLFDNEGNTVFSNEKLEDLKSILEFILSFEKEMGDLGPARDETKEIDLYYKEREWRLVPSIFTNISCTAKPSTDGQSSEYKFHRKAVNVIVVPNEEIRTSVLEYFLSLRASGDTRLKEFGENILPIISYDDLHKW